MRPEDADRSYLLDMLSYARSAVRGVEGRSLEQFGADETCRLATERRIEIIGEAARRISPQFITDHPEIPWRKIIAQRHILAHEYGEIDTELIWRVVTVHLPELVAQLEKLLEDQSVD
jgi:uncharacterized protein with HEPN domain